MTKKDYVRLAAALKSTRPKSVAGESKKWVERDTEVWLQTVKAVTAELVDDNPRFDPQRFMEAAGVNGYLAEVGG